jgi:glycine/D-amino acid oxidase-like deaminating enzyme
MPGTDVDVAVIGAGLMGAATAWALARRGASVALFEARTPGHHEGSSHGSARIFRRAYADALYVAMAGRARELWQELEIAADEVVMQQTGGIDHGRRRDPRALGEVLRAAGVPAALLNRREANLRWPGIAFAGPVLFHGEAGVIDSERAVAAMVRCAVQGGAEWYAQTPVHAIERVAAGVRLHLPDRSVLASTTVVAAGAWTGPLLADLVELPRLTVTQQQIFHFPRRDPGAAWPIFVHDDTLSVYGLPGGRAATAGGVFPAGIKVAEHDRGTVTTADTRTGIVDDAARKRLIGYVERNLPGLEPVPYAEATCLYTWTDSADFLVDRIGPIIVCSPCSGHGAKFAPLIGELAADLALGRAARSPRAHSPLAYTALTRFALAAHRSHTP